MRPSQHLALSGVAGGATWAATGEPWTLAVTVGAGVLVDIDHGPDYWWFFSLRRQPLTVLLLHGWEWFIGLVVLGIFVGFPWWLVAVLVGYGLHLTTDHVFNRGRLLCYSFIFRASYRFQMAKVAPNWDLAHGYDVLRSEMPFAANLIERWNGGRPPSPAGSPTDHPAQTDNAESPESVHLKNE